MAVGRRGSQTMEGGKVLGLELRCPQSKGEGDVNLGGWWIRTPRKQYRTSLSSLFYKVENSVTG